MVGGVRTGGLTALVLVFAVVLAAAAVPMLSGHTPLEAVGPDGSPAIDGVDADDEFDAADDPQEFDSLDGSEAGEGLIHEDFAALADDDQVAETMTGLAGLLAMLFGTEGLEGAVGEPSDDEPVQDGDDPEHEDQDGIDEEHEEIDSGDDDAEEGELDDDLEATGDDSDREGGDDGDADERDGSDGDDEADADDADDSDGDDADADETGSDETSAEGDDSDETDAGEDEQADDDLASAESESDDHANGESADDSDDEGASSDSEAGSEETESFLDRFDPLTIGLLIGGLVAIAAGWFAYRTGRGLLGIVLSIPTLVVGAVSRFVFGITALVERVSRAIRAASSVLALPGLFVAGVVRTAGELAASVGSLFDRGQPTVDAGDVEQLQSEREQIRAAWRSVIEAVADHSYRRRTPGEIKQRALDRGLPERPVSTLVGVFRDVEYGAKDPTDRAASAISAANELSGPADSTERSEESAPDSADGEPTDSGGQQ